MNKTIWTLLAGVVIGILVAPDKGSETLKKVRSRVKDYRDDAAEKAGDLVSKGRDVFQNGRAPVSETME